MNSNILKNFSKNIVYRENIKNLRKIEPIERPCETTVFCTRRLGLFLPKFVLVVLKNSYQLKFCDFKLFLKNNLFLLMKNYDSDVLLKDFFRINF